MAIVALTNGAQEVAEAGIAPSYQGSLSASDTYTFPNDGRTMLHFKKSGAGACTVTIVTAAEFRGAAVADTTLTVPATTGDKMIGPFHPDKYSASDGLVTFSCSEITGLTVAAIRLPAAS